MFDAGGNLFKYQCYWMNGHGDDQMIERPRPAEAAEVAKTAA
jgi:hypothetical protein